MYLTEIMQYLLWPMLIAATWFAIRLALMIYDKRFPGKG